jgi:hypothetical protein
MHLSASQGIINRFHNICPMWLCLETIYTTSVGNSSTDRNVLACDPSCLFRYQQKHSICNVRWSTSPPGSSCNINCGLLKFHCRVRVCQNRTRGNSVDSDSLTVPPLIDLSDVLSLLRPWLQLTSLAQDHVRLSRAALEAP